MKKKGEKKSEKRHTEDMFKAATTAVVPKSLMALSSMALCAVKNVLLMNESVQVISNQKYANDYIVIMFNLLIKEMMSY